MRLLRNRAPPGLHATLRGFDEAARLAVFDRTGNHSGRLAREGILQRFVGGEYDLDVVSSGFLLSEEYEWYRRDSGARFWAGSIDHIHLIQHAEFTGTVGLGGTWSARAQLTHQQTLLARRSLVQIAFRRDVAGSRLQVFLAGTLQQQKPDADIKAGVTWRPGFGSVTLAVASLDAFSDFIHQGLGVSDLTDSVIDYTAHPFTARLAVDLAPSPRFRVELYTLAMTPTGLEVDNADGSAGYFHQDERYAYAGVLLERSPGRHTAGGPLATWVRARMDRTQLPGGLAGDNFDQVRKTWRIGGFALRRLSARVTLEARLTRLFRSEDGTPRPPSGDAATAYTDKAWIGLGNFQYGAPSGFRLDLGLDVSARAIRDSGSPGFGYRAENNYRVRADVGWSFGQRAMFVLGGNADLDRDNRGSAGWFDGAHGRFAFYW
jgi:hypothetical protein